jgi:hypothetical protein
LDHGPEHAQRIAKGALLEADRGESESTPFIALTGVTLIVGVAVLAMIVIVIAAIFIAS